MSGRGDPAEAARTAGDVVGGEPTGQRLGIPGVRPPKPMLSPEAERALSARQLEVLDLLEQKLREEALADLTMAQIAALTNCSLRTLYGIAPSKDELLLTIVDRRLRRIGRAAIAKLAPDLSPLDALRAYLAAANEAVQPEAVALSSDLANVAGAPRLLAGHEAYLVGVAQSLLDRAVAEGEIPPIDTAAVAHVLGGLGRDFARPEVAETVHSSPKEAADGVAELIFLGLRATRR